MKQRLRGQMAVVDDRVFRQPPNQAFQWGPRCAQEPDGRTWSSLKLFCGLQVPAPFVDLHPS
jgi:hypothetical protein